MLNNLGWDHVLILALAALVIFGPERLPGAVTSFTGLLRRARQFATDTQEQFKDGLGPELEELRKPLEDLQRLRQGPRQLITDHLFGGDDSLFTGRPPVPRVTPGTAPVFGPATPLAAGERPTFDTEAT
ncbi:Sec-independent protein translocase subunit TatB [Rhodococcus spelaei]|uniref:Sec-independent protein translocase subunit TatB n=1 Tax=Rhodococcus spelaei TaxID=2546320 RepID=A0A541B7M5_9NOCA|nr:twin-arginine translocase TatA/TatE family subunit [Rhodococcus spelaei]TQF68298.1 Sec-independent protein translocase subunit TatB [Rhodococcus spelaei]